MNTPMGGEDPPSPGTDYDPDIALMQSRAIGDLQRQMKWMTDLIAKYEEEILVGGDGQKFIALADMLGSDPQFQRKWRLIGKIDAIEIENPGTLRQGVIFDSSIEIQNLDDTFDMELPDTRLYLEGTYNSDEGRWNVTLKADKNWENKFPIKKSEDSYDFTTFYYPIAVTKEKDSFEDANIEPDLFNKDVGIMVVVPDSDLTLDDSYFVDNDSNDGYYMVYPTPLPGDIYL